MPRSPSPGRRHAVIAEHAPLSQVDDLARGSARALDFDSAIEVDIDEPDEPEPEPRSCCDAPKDAMGRALLSDADQPHLLDLEKEWALSAVIGVLVLWLAIDNSECPLIEDLSASQAFFLLDVAAPLVLVVLGYAVGFSFAGAWPVGDDFFLNGEQFTPGGTKVLGLAALYAGLTALAFRLDALRPWLTASCAGALLPFYLIVLVLERKEGRQVYNYGTYTFLAPSAVGTYNVAAYIVAREYDLSDDCRWKLAAFGGSTLTMLLNFVTMAPCKGCEINWSQTFRYWAGQLCMYLFLFKGVCQWLERGLLLSSGTPCEWVQEEPPPPLLPEHTGRNHTSGVDDEELWGSWQWSVTLSVTLLWLTYRLISQDIPVSVAKELCCPFRPFARRQDASQPARSATCCLVCKPGWLWCSCCEESSAPAGFATPEDHVRSASFLRWMYWSAGVVIGALFMASTLPEVLYQAEWSSSFLLWFKLILGTGMVHVHSGMMRGRTIEHNAEYLKGARGRPDETDANWRMKKSMCQVIQLVLWPSFGSYFIYHDAGIGTGCSARLFDADSWCETGRPLLLKQMDVTAIALICLVNVVRIVFWISKNNHVFWIERTPRRSAGNLADEVMEPYGRIEPFIRMMCAPQADTAPLEERLAHRESRTPPDGTEGWDWGRWWLKDDDTGKTLTHTDVLTRVYDDDGINGRGILSAPKTQQVDNHTLLFIYLAKSVVTEGRLKAFLVSDVKLPFPRQSLKTMVSAVADIEFAWSDEYDSPNANSLQLDFNAVARTGLWAVSQLQMIDKPRWFDSELEAVVLLESTLRDMLPPVSHTWPEMSSDEAMSTLAFCGLGQLYLLSRTAWEEQRAQDSGRPQGAKRAKERQKFYAVMQGSGAYEAEYPRREEVPTGTEYVIDLSAMSKYEVREEFAHYGAAVFFDKDRRLLAVYKSHYEADQRSPRGRLSEPVLGKLVYAPGSARGRLTDHDEWENAKFSFRCSLISLTTLREHLTMCHWIVSNRVHIASREELGAEHPVRRILSLFTFRSGAINFVSTVTLMQEDMLLHRASPFTAQGVLEAFEDTAARWRYQTFDQMEQAKGLPKGFLPYMQDAKECWEAFHAFFAGYIGLYFPTEADVTDDREIQRYWQSLERVSNVRWQPDAEGEEYRSPAEPFKAPPLPEDGPREWRGRYNGYGLPQLSKAALVDQLTHTAFWVCGMHEVRQPQPAHPSHTREHS